MELIKACTEKAKKEDMLRACMMRTDGRPARQADMLQRKENLPEKIVRITINPIETVDKGRRA